jgi:hypothetical protein
VVLGEEWQEKASRRSVRRIRECSWCGFVDLGRGGLMVRGLSNEDAEMEFCDLSGCQSWPIW